MKNTELVRTKGIEQYIGIMEEIKPMKQDKYTVLEASEYFSCTRSQIRGYIQNYKDVMKDNATVIGAIGKQTTILNKKAMFFIALLLCDKSIVSTMIFKAVEKAYLSDKAKIEVTEKITKEQLSATEVQASFELDKMSKEIKPEKEEDEKVKVKVVSIENGQLCINEEEMTIAEFEAKKEASEVEAKKAMKSFIDELTCKKKEAESKIKEDIEKKPSNIIDFQDLVRNAIKKEKRNQSNIGIQIEDSSLESFSEELERQAIKFMFHNEMKLEKMKYEEEAVNLIFEAYMRRCLILGLSQEESAILIQETLVEDGAADDLDKIILDRLVAKKELEYTKKRGSLREAINLLAVEKFKGEHREAYHHISREMRYIIGFDMTNTRANSKQTPNSYLDMIMEYNAYEEAMNLIHALLAE